MGGRLSGKTALVTGAARGTGEATARLFASEGARVVIADVLDAEGEAVAKEIGDSASFAHLDVSNEDDWASALKPLDRLDVLINNAGILRFASIEEEALGDYMKVINVNQVGVFLGMRAAIPLMKKAGGGSIVNVSSVEGLRGLPRLSAYAASKFAVRGMTKVAAVELGKFGIRVNSIHPGGVDTPMVREQGLQSVENIDFIFKGIPLRRAGKPADLANMMLFLASDESSYCTGAEFVIDGGATAFVGWGGHQPRV
ncbi:MAG: glucose 1-dehydrogenase [Actinomycetota bacterium]